MAHLNIAKLAAAQVETDPFQYTIVPAFLPPDSVRRINETFPPISAGGSYAIESLDGGMTIKEVIEELDGPEFEAVVAEKFKVALSGKPKMYSLRGHTRPKDGRIHTDSEDKIITVLLYFNETWPHAGGRLRLLRNGRDVDNFVAEVPPDNGTLLIFKRSNNSWHGHRPFEGQRRALQMNWMTSDRARGWHNVRHRLSAAVKSMRGGGRTH